ncbi:SbmA/BacA-like family transporter [Sphingomonas abietis]|uniref:ATP-binding cassette domain-containing protein n=1 Tax=Sphingomonas abietis TaxID=3012344 RepID=A0ABY7NPC7_9SPHN|nr:SbmA/BacA-like family transporter [Sphingomonas abietis]WBO22321.1 ATP-binding cassette domain-containing protein [Sphingomonas abietis]
MVQDVAVERDPLSSPEEAAVVLSERPPEIQVDDVWRDVRYGAKLIGLYLRAHPWRDGTLIAVFAVLIIGNGYLGLLSSLASADLMNALAVFNRSAAMTAVGQLVIAATILVAAALVSELLRYILKIRARTILNDRFVEKWMSDDRYYHLGTQDKLDHPEQRIQDDVNIFVTSIIEQGPGIFYFITPLVLYSAQLWRLSPPLEVNFFGTEYILYGYLLYGVLIFSILWTVFTHFIGRKLTRTEVVRQRLEAQFRQEMASIRENREAIAFERGAGLEYRRLTETFSLIRRNWRDYTVANLRVIFATRTPNAVLSVIASLICVPFVLNRTMRIGDIAIVSMAMAVIFQGAGVLVVHYQSLAILRSSASRLRYFDEAMDVRIGGDLALEPAGERAFELHDLTIQYPNGEPMLTVPEFRIAKGSRILVKGPSGSGKSTLLRAVAGLWPHGTGSIRLPDGASVTFLPQRSFMPTATLAGLLTYPQDPARTPDAVLGDLLVRLGLSSLTGRLHEYRNWRDILSPGGRGLTSIREWRQRRGLPANVPPPREKMPDLASDFQPTPRKSYGRRGCVSGAILTAHEAQYQQGYALGLSDKKLAEFVGVAERSAFSWRRRRGLPSNNPDRAHLSPEARAARMLLYSFGYSDARVAREQGVSPSAIERWRGVLKLPANRAHRWDKTTRCRGSRESTDVLTRIKRALPGYLSPADRDDAASNLYMAVMSGGIPIAEIERRAKKFGNAVIGEYASKFGARSLNEDISTDGDGFTLMDTLVDESSSSWLEEMGATVW